jgi:hypothetical protein
VNSCKDGKSPHIAYLHSSLTHVCSVCSVTLSVCSVTLSVTLSVHLLLMKLSALIVVLMYDWRVNSLSLRS